MSTANEQDPTVAALMAFCMMCLILFYAYMVKNGKKVWRDWIDLVGELRVRRKIGKSEKRETNIKRARNKKKSESERRRIGQC